uniref:Homeobox domain-containing protein n=1 Tax=Leersia perrieri TaxID=77586 RepID=A0A0D9WXE4_9ORYZ
MDNKFQQHSDDAHVLDLPITSMLEVDDGMEETNDSAGDDPDYGGEGKDEATSFKRMKRHNDVQIKELESVFERNNYVGRKQRKELAKKLGMEEKQVKFWFQNQRTRKKMHDERHETMVLQEENKALAAKNKVLKEAISDQICLTCNRPVVLPAAKTIQMWYLRFENMRLHGELQRATVVLNQLTQDANAGAVALTQFGSSAKNSQTRLVIDSPTPLKLENVPSPNSANAINP